MSTSILYHGFGIRGYLYVRSEYQQGTIVFTVEKDRPSSLRCPCCNSRDVTRRGALPRYFHVLPIGKKRVYIKLYVPRSSNIHMLGAFSVTIGEHRAGILAYYDFPISRGPLEGTNSKIKTLQ